MYPIDRREIKALARERIRTARPSPLMVGAVFFILGWVINGVSLMLESTVMEVDWNLIRAGGDAMEAVTYFPDRETFVYDILVFLINLISIVLSAGMVIYAMRVMRGIVAGVGDLFDGFTWFFRIIWLEALMRALVLLWTLLFIIPGILASYGYSMAIYLLFDHPDWSVMRCLRESKALMRGHKWELFKLDLSFIGWNLLTIIPFVSVYVTPYVQLTRAEFFNRLVGYAPFREEEKAPWEY